MGIVEGSVGSRVNYMVWAPWFLCSWTCFVQSSTLVQAGMLVTGNETALLDESKLGLDESTMRIGSRPDVGIVLVELEVVDISLAVLNLRRAITSAVCSKAVGVTEEGMLATLLLCSM